MYTLLKKDNKTRARRGVIRTSNGEIQAPFFMPVGTNGSVKTLTAEDLNEVGAQIMLSNTYHLFLRPGMDIIKNAGGLHKFISWDKPMLTDSGGYQVFSLAKLRKMTDEGVKFQSHIDGSFQFFSPENVVEVEQILGSDMIMPLDVCAPYPCGRHEAEQSVERTTLWAKRSKEYFDANQADDKRQFLFGIIQGSIYKDLREQSAIEIMDIGFDGYAIGGVSVGEPVKDMFDTLDWVLPLLPEDKPRYFMGIGLPDQIVKAVGMGIDMFDTCIPTRFGRHASAFTRKGKVILKNKEYASDLGPIDEACECMVCKKYSKSYLRHLAVQKEISGLKLITYHNLYFYINMMKDIRNAIEDDRYEDFQNKFLEEYGSELRNR